MKDPILIAGALVGGITVGLMFFGGLWWTVQRAGSSAQPGLLFAGSFMLRTLLAMAAFYLIGQGSWQRLVVCLVGFVVGRILVKRFSQVSMDNGCELPREGVR